MKDYEGFSGGEFPETGVNPWGTQESCKDEPGFEPRFRYSDYAAKREFELLEKNLVQHGAVTGNAELAVDEEGNIQKPLQITSLRTALRAQYPEELLLQLEKPLYETRTSENN